MQLTNAELELIAVALEERRKIWENTETHRTGMEMVAQHRALLHKLLRVRSRCFPRLKVPLLTEKDDAQGV